MKTSLLLFFLTFSLSLFAQLEIDPASNTSENYALALIEAGTPVFLTTHNEMSTKHLKSGQTVCLYLKFPIKVDGFKIIPGGTPAYCKISQAQKPGGNGRAGYLEVEPLWLQISKDEVLPLSGNPTVRMGRDREFGSHAAVLAGQAAAGLLEQGQELHDVALSRRAMRKAKLQEAIAQKQYEKGYGGDPYANAYYAPAAPEALAGPGGAIQVARTITNVIPLVGLLIRGKHAIIPRGYILNAYVADDLVVEVME